MSADIKVQLIKQLTDSHAMEKQANSLSQNSMRSTPKGKREWPSR